MISFLGRKIEMLPLFYVLIICKTSSKFRNVKIWRTHMDITYRLRVLFLGSFIHMLLKSLLSMKPKIVPGLKADS